MHTSFIAMRAFFAAETETGSQPATSLLPSDSPATGARILETVEPVEKPATAAIRAAIKADGEKRAAQRKLSGAATGKPAKAGKPSKPAAKPATGTAEPNKPATHEMRGSYTGASPTFRMHGRKLSPIVLDRIPGSFTERDAAFIGDLYTKHGTKPFKRYDADAGNVSRAIGHGYIRHHSGNLDSRTAEFAVTERYVRERKQKASAKPAK